jgi:hypothetical protein
MSNNSNDSMDIKTPSVPDDELTITGFELIDENTNDIYEKNIFVEDYERCATRNIGDITPNADNSGGAIESWLAFLDDNRPNTAAESEVIEELKRCADMNRPLTSTQNKEIEQIGYYGDEETISYFETTKKSSCMYADPPATLQPYFSAGGNNFNQILTNNSEPEVMEVTKNQEKKAKKTTEKRAKEPEEIAERPKTTLRRSTRIKVNINKF